MRLRIRWLGAGVFTLSSLAMLGCVAADYPGKPSPLDLAHDLTPPESPRLARMQRPDGAPALLPPVKPAASPVGGIAPPPAAPPSLAPARTAAIDIPPPPPPGAPGGTDSGAQQVALRPARNARTSVRAWVNGRPIFDEEVMLSLEMTNPAIFSETDREKVLDAVSKSLTNLVDMEVAYQDAVKKLEKANPRALDKLKDYVDQEFERSAREIRKKNEAKFQEVAHTYRRVLERQFIGMEYIRSRIGQATQIGNQEIKEYYDAHLNEFQKVATVKWQHVFIAMNAQRPTLTDARRFAESLLEQARVGNDFGALLKYDEGDSKSRGGLGFGTRSGEIQPAELEQYLFKMTKGQVGLLELSTGVHLFRLVEREDAGQVPLNDTVQTQIRNKLRNQIFDRELKRLIRELKTRAIVEIENGN